MRQLRGLGAIGVIVLLVAGFPAGMVAMGVVPWPTGPLPDLDSIVGVLLRPDDGTVVLRVVAVLGWAAWAMWTASLAVEVTARVRGVRVPRIRGLGWSQTLAAGLVGAAMLTLTTPVPPAQATAPVPVIATVAAGVTTPPAAAVAATVVIPQADQADRAGQGEGDRGGAETSTPQLPLRTHTVRAGDTLWQLAEQHLGAGERWREIAALNVDRPQPDGRALGWDGMLLPGWTLHLPTTGATGIDDAHAGEAVAAVREHTVRAGDTLWDLADAHLGAGERWPEIYQASRSVIQPGGVRLSDPDLIDVGWTLQLPTTSVAPRPNRLAAADPADVDAAPATDDAAGPASSAGEKRDPASAAPGSASLTDTRTGVEASPTPPAAPVDEAAGLAAADGAAAATPRPPTTSPDPAPGPTLSSATQTTPGETSTADPSEGAWPAWVLAGLAGAGALLSGAAALVLLRRRRTQFRHRRPGRAPAAPPLALAPVEQTLIAVGTLTAPDTLRIHDALRALAVHAAAAGRGMPALAAVQLEPTAIHLHLHHPDDLPAPWTAASERTRWTLPHTAPLEEVDPDTPAPYPLLTPVGQDADGVWLLNLEGHAYTVTGDATMAEDLLRFLATGLGVYPWAEGVRVDCCGIAHEVASSTLDRLHVAEEEGMLQAVADAVAVLDRAAAEDVTALPDARAGQVGLDVWPARVLLVNQAHPAADTPATAQLLDLVAAHPGTVGTSVVIRADDAPNGTTDVPVGGDGRVQVLGRDLEAVGLTPDEAAGLGLLLDQAASIDDTPMPVADDGTGWQGLTDRAGALRPELTEPRDPAGGGEQSLLPEPDATYLSAAATTAEDLHTLAPPVPDSVAAELAEADPDLDADLHEWRHGGPRPKLRVLGDLELRAAGQAPARRRPHYTELIAFLHSRDTGATTTDVGRYFTSSRVAKDVSTLRAWLGRRPDGRPWLPDARDTDNRYTCPDLLTDVDLFYRLRARGQARGADGLPDLIAALGLVTGQPYSGLRVGGGAWLADGQRLDEYARCAVVDTAHLVVTAALAAGDLTTATAAAQAAVLAAPESEVTAADLAAIAAAEGRHADLDRHLQHVADYAEPGEAPEEPSRRGTHVLNGRQWAERAS